MNSQNNISKANIKPDMYLKKRTAKGHKVDTFSIDGQFIAVPENLKTGLNLTVINRHNKQHVFINGYEITDGRMRRTLRAFWHKWF